jgi:predicted nuclease of predicted toxin-antitoxin system
MATRPTFFVDRSLGKGVGRALRDAGATVELHDDYFAQETADVDWIATVTQNGWVILTKDKYIRRRRNERDVVQSAKARIFTLRNGNMRGADMAAIFVAQLTRMEELATTEPPFVYLVDANGCELAQLAPVPPPTATEADAEPNE